MTLRNAGLGLLVLSGMVMLGSCPVNRPEPEPAATPEPIIIDNTDAGAAVLAGDWETAPTTDGNGSYGPDFLYHFADRENVNTVRYTPIIQTAGTYTVSIWWSAAENRTADQPVLVHDANGDTTYHVNLQEHGNQWFELGQHVFSVGADGYVEFTSDTADGYCNADAVRFVFVAL